MLILTLYLKNLENLNLESIRLEIGKFMYQYKSAYFLIVSIMICF